MEPHRHQCCEAAQTFRQEGCCRHCCKSHSVIHVERHDWKAAHSFRKFYKSRAEQGTEGVLVSSSGKAMRKERRYLLGHVKKNYPGICAVWTMRWLQRFCSWPTRDYSRVPSPTNRPTCFHLCTWKHSCTDWTPCFPIRTWWVLEKSRL